MVVNRMEQVTLNLVQKKDQKKDKIMESKMKKIAILEDEPVRIEIFKRAFPNAFISSNPHEFTLHVLKEDPDELRLDHDLGWFTPDGDEVNGTHVAQQLAPLIRKDTTVIIHSWSPRASGMRLIFLDYGVENVKIQLFDARYFA